MNNDNKLTQIRLDDFARRFSMRTGNLMWLLGAGASASAGIPTASDMIWEFKQQLFISQRRISPQAVADLSNPSIREQLREYVKSIGSVLPSLDNPDEYAALFEAAYPSEADRRTFLNAKMAGGKPSYGHLALATLMRANLTRLIWTTNFDSLVADACAKVYDATGPLTTVTLDSSDIALQCINEGRWPIEIKLHGDFHSRRLKNTGDELRHQDARLRDALVNSCMRFGLIVVGYSGRDESIMDTLYDVLKSPGAFPGGLFWLYRSDVDPLPRVAKLISDAAKSGVEAGFVCVENFDEALRDLIRLVKNIDTSVLDAFAMKRRRWSSAPLPVGNRAWPVVRFNALPLLQIPNVCRCIVCQINTYAEIHNAIEQAGVDILVARTKAGVLAFGADADVLKVFQPYSITDFNLHTIETRRLRYESGERGLLRNALTLAIARQRNLDVMRHRNSDLLAPTNPSDLSWKRLQLLVGQLGGTVKGYSDLQWREGIGTRLDFAGDRLWLLIEPRTVFDGITNDNRAAAADFARERTVKRYNRQLNDLIEFWGDLLFGDGLDLRSFGIGDGVDATFSFSSDTGFSRRAQL